MSRQRTFEVKQKAFSIIFKGLSVAKNHIKPESAPLNFNGRVAHLASCNGFTRNDKI